MPQPGCAVCGMLLQDPEEACPLCATNTPVKMSAIPDLPGFRIISLLGRGGMGAVYLAEELSLGRSVAIKVLAHKHQDDPEARDRFQREARSLAGIDHPNVLRIHRLGEAHGDAFIVMEYVEGESVAKRILRGPLAPAEALRITRQAADGLAAAWAKGIIHRDVKPSNLMLDSNHQVRVADFGIAKPVQVGASFVTATGMVVGTPHYVAPEQARGEAVDLRTDVYSLGVTLFEMVTGTRPFTGKTPVEVLAHHLHTPMPALPAECLTPELDRAISRMTQKRPADRPGSHAELSDLLQGSGGFPGNSTAVAESLTTTTPSPSPKSAPATPPPDQAMSRAMEKPGPEETERRPPIPEALTEATPPTFRARMASRFDRAHSRGGVIAIFGIVLVVAVSMRFLRPARPVVTYDEATVDVAPEERSGNFDSYLRLDASDAERPEGCLGTVSVVVEFVITETGEVTQIATPNPKVAGEAMLSVSQRKYIPGRKEGDVVRVRSRSRFTNPSEFKTVSAIQSQVELIEQGRMPPDQAVGCVPALEGALKRTTLPGETAPAGFFAAQAAGALVAIPRVYPSVEDADLDSIGWILAKGKRPAEAIVVFEMAAARIPETGRQWERIGDGFKEAGDEVKARRAYRQASSVDPTRLSVGVKLSALKPATSAEKPGPGHDRTEALIRVLVETKLDLARRVLANKDYEGAIAQASEILKVDSDNPEALGIREQARSAIREIAASVAAVRDAVNRGDSAQAAAALERVLARDPRNPIVAEASRQLNANFAQRATGAKTEMEQARLRAYAKGGAAQDPAFAEGETLAGSAARSLKDRQFTTAAQTYLQARDAYDRARHVIEGQEAAAALEVRRAAATAVARATPAAGTGEKWRDLPVYAEIDVDKAPLPFSHEIPKPRVDKQASVILSWIVTPEGLVDDVKIVSSTSPEASALVVEGLKTWRYEPGQKDGKPVPVRVLRKYTFTPR